MNKGVGDTETENWDYEVAAGLQGGRNKERGTFGWESEP